MSYNYYFHHFNHVPKGFFCIGTTVCPLYNHLRKKKKKTKQKPQTSKTFHSERELKKKKKLAPINLPLQRQNLTE